MWMQAAILLAALLLRVHRIGVHEFWLDETFSFQDATAVHWAWDLRLRDMPPLYTVLLHGWIGVAGTDEGALRLLSALLGTLAVGATMWLARQMGGPRAVVPAGVVAALAPMHVYYSQEARPYAILLLLIPVILGLVHRAVTHDRVRDWVPVCLVATVILYTHYLGGLALLGTAGMLLVAPSRRVANRWAVSMAVAGLLFLPWVAWSFLLVSHSTAGLGWIADAWARTPWAIPRSLEMFVIGPRAGALSITLKQFDTLTYPEPLRWLALSAAGALALWLVVPAGNAPLGPGLGARVVALVVSMLTPLVVLLLVSFVKPIYLVGRYDMLGFPAFPVLMGLAWAKLEAVGLPRARVVVPALAAACLLPVAVKLFRYYTQPAVHPENSAAAAERLAAKLASGDVVLFPDLRGHVVLYQLARRGWAWRGAQCEQDASGMRVGCDVLPPMALDAAVRGDAAPLRDALGRALDDHPGAVFIVHGTWAVGANGPMVLPGDVAVIGELSRLGYRPGPGDWEVGITEYRRP